MDIIDLAAEHEALDLRGRNGDKRRNAFPIAPPTAFVIPISRDATPLPRRADMLDQFGLTALLIVATLFFVGGFIKGLVGFALPLIAVTGAASILPAQTAVATVILPVLISNLFQALRQGVRPLLATFRRFWALNIMLGAMIFLGANLLPGLNERSFFALIGAVTFSAALIQLLGWRPRIAPRWEQKASLIAGGVGGVIGGLSGIWGPPVVLFMNALRLDKEEHKRAIGLAFLIGALILAPAHMHTGVLDSRTLPFSAALIIPTVLGMAMGGAAEKRLDAEMFRKATLIVLLLASLNLLRRAIFA
ncbi:MAG: sulfite exporter TauE/SafE family protein [Neomegalonema sp.]|nr:sulfite exporter TauE/SafE family protein [Neomegalonema sp.]